MRFFKCALNLSAVIVIAAGAVSADTFYNNLGTTVAGYGSVNGYAGLWNSFSTGSTAENLTDVQVRLENTADPAPASVTVTLYANNANTPGAALLTLGSINDNQVSFTGGVYDFPVSPGYPLRANTRYWIGITTSNGSFIGWAWNNESVSAAGTGTGGEYHCYGNGSCLANGNDPFLMLVSGAIPQAVPALSPVALVALGILLMAIPLWIIRRKRHVAS